MRRSWLTSWVCVMLLASTLGAGGCGADVSRSDRSPPSPSSTKAASADAGAATHPQVSAARGNDRIISATPRRVIYTADVSMQTRDFAKAERAIPDLVQQVGGYLTEISLNRQQGEQRSGRWQARIPAEHFHEFLEGLDEIGVPDRRQVTGQDVSEEYVDLEMRLVNKKRLEERLLELMKVKSGTVTDVIEFERQVAQVREEIERMEGRFRYLTNRSDLSTISISLREVNEYVPPQDPTFATRLADTWAGTVGTFRDWGEGIVLGGLHALPWLVAVALLAIVAMGGRRLTLRLMTASKS